jgi:hypothetical protein
MRRLINLAHFLFPLQLFFVSIISAQCPTGSPPTTDPPNSVVRVQVLSVKPNSDLEGDDDYVPFYDNHADIFGKVTIEGNEFNLPEVEDSDFPHWTNTFDQHVTSSPVTIRIQMWENDAGLTGNNDDVDINPDPNKDELILVFDLCALTVMEGTTQHSSQGVIEINAGSGSEQATIRLKIETADGRPVTANDLALMESDLIQVLFQTQKMVSGKPTIVMARIANNYTTTINTNVRVIVSGAGVNRNDLFPLSIAAGEVKKEYYYLNNPIRFPESANVEHVTVMIRVDDANNQSLDPLNCMRMNDGNPNRIIWKTVHTPRRFEFMWAKTGTLLDGGNFVSDAQFESNMELGSAYIHGVYPLSFPNNYESLIDLLPPLSAATDFLTTILSVFGIPGDNVIPYALVLELNGVANIVGCDRLMGVLPNKDWFKRFSYDFLDEVTGLSLGEFAPRAVIFLPQYGETTNLGPAMTLPAHEVGHTFGLSTDPTLKDSWVCDVDWPVLGHSGCGFAGGFDEYKSAMFPKGNPSNGFWIAQGNEPSSLAGLLNKEQCNSFCFMGPSPSNSHLDWTNKGKWIDAADYDQLVTKLQKQPDPEVIFVSGIIAWNDQMYLGSVQHIGDGIPDRDTSFGAYAIQLKDINGNLLKEVGLPVNWNSADITSRPRPVTFFALNIEYKSGARRLEIINRMSGKVLASKKISANKPAVRLSVSDENLVPGNNIHLTWRGSDRDHERLQYFMLARSARDESWFPVEYWKAGNKSSISSSKFESGSYVFKVMASDGVHVSASNEVPVNIN